jgi:hypothetical protein
MILEYSSNLIDYKNKKGEWIIVENLPLTKKENNSMQYHIIGGNLFKRDEEINQ